MVSIHKVPVIVYLIFRVICFTFRFKRGARLLPVPHHKSSRIFNYKNKHNWNWANWAMCRQTGTTQLTQFSVNLFVHAHTKQRVHATWCVARGLVSQRKGHRVVTLPTKWRQPWFDTSPVRQQYIVPEVRKRRTWQCKHFSQRSKNKGSVLLRVILSRDIKPSHTLAI